MERGSGVIWSIIDEVHPLNIQGDQMQGESGFTRTIIDELEALDILRDQMEG